MISSSPGMTFRTLVESARLAKVFNLSVYLLNWFTIQTDNYNYGFCVDLTSLMTSFKKYNI